MPITEIANLRAPGWSRVVSELSAAAPDDRVYVLRLVSALGQVAGARQAVFWSIAGQPDNAASLEPRAVLAWPFGPGVVDAQGRMTVPAESLFESAGQNDSTIDSAAEVKAAVRAVASSREVGVYSLDAESQMYDAAGGRGHVIAVPVPQGLPHEAGTLPLLGVITLLIDARSRQALQTTLAFVEVLTGYVYTHWSQKSILRLRASSAALELAARLIAALNSTTEFKGCTLRFVNDLARQLAVDRVALGWVHGGNPLRTNTQGARSAHCIALSDTENLDRRMAMVQKIEASMDECLDQAQTILFPPPTATGDAVLSQAITHAHRELAARDSSLKVASFPLRIADPAGDKIVGVVLVESSGPGRIELPTIELLQATLDLVAPVLAVRHSDDRAIPLRTWDWMVRTAAWAVGTKHTVWKAAAVLVMAGLLFCFFYTTTYRVGAPMELQPRVRRTISMPFDGTIARVGAGVEEGKPVAAGQLLAELDTREMLLSAMEADNQFVQFDKQADDSLRKGELAEAVQARARAEQARARRDLLRSQIGRSTLTAPFAGTITTGDLKDKVGAAVKLGERLFEVADLSDMQVIVKTDDRDIALVRVGATGQVSPKADPSRTVDFTVEQIVPLARAEEGTNTFEVRGKIAGPLPAWVLPGMEGQARINTERHSLAWIAGRRIIDQLRVWLWW
jgi:multidrug resistance efflux pump